MPIFPAGPDTWLGGDESSSTPAARWSRNGPFQWTWYDDPPEGPAVVSGGLFGDVLLGVGVGD
ncbi:hypothetical protein [Micromonospora sp. CPCC 206061]|uniref:hypothetical protein n=1 Tax=Micromonospora sp. CPCC 206061 TaxID=3122410 RepID=UPI002FF15455